MERCNLELNKYYAFYTFHFAFFSTDFRRIWILNNLLNCCSTSNNVPKKWRNIYTLHFLQTFLVSLLKNWRYTLTSQHLLFYWMLTFLKEKAETFLTFLAFLRVASSVQWALCTLQDTCKTSKKRGLCHTFRRPLIVGLNCMRHTSVELMQ